MVIKILAHVYSFPLCHSKLHKRMKRSLSTLTMGKLRPQSSDFRWHREKHRNLNAGLSQSLWTPLVPSLNSDPVPAFY